MHYVIAGGGTGGHIYPAAAIAERLSDSGRVTMLARSGSMEERIFLSQGFDVRTVASAPLLYDPGSLWRLVRATGRGVRAARRVMTDVHADAFIGTGGYVSVPGIIAAHLSRVPVYLLEQNTVMGRANRLFSHCARRVFLGFPVVGARGPRFALTGNPLRRDVYVALTECRSSRPLRRGLLFIGGSGGADFINGLFLHTIRELDSKERDVEVTVVTGTDGYTGIRDAVDKLALRHVQATVIAYEDHMERLYAHTRVAVTRGGALVLTELAVGGIYAVAIPYPFSVGGHQSKNAAHLEKLGLGVRIEQSLLKFEGYLSIVEKALDDERPPEVPASSVFGGDAAAAIARSIREECSGD
ncbi:MAG TPA: UDP-N-acetylglucosamine--N-acetylmuramyl-(pentapeptide) pyrophosphoryl-undecaprenol N-acetylglucosamine transferase [Clostridia bacterium]|nr:UDP-N-acetylglucosamine--N-acetylmuramyl-(pentapeptide) pyrophosphoryl-undecaprenol N-acetylglucosamine transferase [Clostridia bacterium]